MALAVHISKNQSVEIGYDIIQLLRYYYRFLNKILGWIIALPIAFVLGLILLILYPIAWGAMKYINSRLKKMVYETTNLEITAFNYHETIKLFMKMNKTVSELKSINFKTKDKSVWFFKPMVSEISTYSGRLIEIHSILKAKTQELNPATEGNLLKPLCTDELWNSRTKAYSYLA